MIEARTKRRRPVEPTDEEDAAIAAAAASDPDALELTDEQLERMSPGSALFPELTRRRGPQRNPTKMSVTIRLDPDVVQRFKSDGPGWQVRINAALRKAAGLDR